VASIESECPSRAPPRPSRRTPAPKCAQSCERCLSRGSIERERCESERARLIGSARRVAGACFHARLRPIPRIPLRPSPGSKTIQVHSLAESPPQSSFASPPASGLSPTHEPAEVSALIAASPGASTCRERSPSPATFRPQAFSASRRLAPRFGFAGLFHPTSHVQGSSPSRGFSLRTAVLGLPSPLPPCRWPPPAHAPPLPEGTLPRRAGLDFEALLHAEKRSFDLVLPAPNVAPLIGLPSSGCCVSSPKRRSPVASARGLCSPSPSVSRSRPRPTFGVSQARARRRIVSASTRPARGFDLVRSSLRLASIEARFRSAAHRDEQRVLITKRMVLIDPRAKVRKGDRRKFDRSTSI